MIVAGLHCAAAAICVLASAQYCTAVQYLLPGLRVHLPGHALLKAPLPLHHQATAQGRAPIHQDPCSLKLIISNRLYFMEKNSLYFFKNMFLNFALGVLYLNTGC